VSKWVAMDLFPDSLPPGVVLLEGLPPGALARLCPQELARHEEFPAAKRKHDWLLGRLAGKEAARRALAERGQPAPGDLELPISSLPSGAPRLEASGPELALTITHGHGYAAAWATEPGPGGGLPGLDLEKIKKRPPGTFRFYLHAEERAWLEALPGSDAGAGPRDLAAIVCWALKEAAFKALQPPRGTGLLDVALDLDDPLADEGRAAVRYLNAAAPRAHELGVATVDAGWQRSGEFVLAWVYAKGARLPK
jgi:phosphopantetheinyl transferase (holo-ACP synthase)